LCQKGQVGIGLISFLVRQKVSKRNQGVYWTREMGRVNITVKELVAIKNQRASQTNQRDQYPRGKGGESIERGKSQDSVWGETR